ncbi:MAG: glycoside hydrolase family 13 protein [Leucobacter sp.]
MTVPEPVHAASDTDAWWASAVIYQVYPRSFADSDGDGMGDLPGISSRLPHLRDLGVDAVWISPFYPSPQADAGYDVADYCDIDPLFGSLADADALIARAHELGLRVFVDLVPNHTSDEHPWFRRALAAAPGSPERDWYVFREPDPADPARLPNDWPSEFGGPAWSTSPDGQWYLHLFDSKQPDLNWANPAVREAFEDILRFWLDRGVDGFRVDVAHGLVKADGLPDVGRTREELQEEDLPTHLAPYWDQDGVHEIYRSWRAILDAYPGDRAMVAEAWVKPYERLARYVRSDEHHQAFNFAFLDARWNASALRTSIVDSYRANDAVGAPTTWVLSNHDVIRHATRLGLDPEEATAQLGPAVEAPDPAVGLRRARAATALMLALPGSAYVYQGEELGLPEVLDLDPSVRQDPMFRRTDGERLGRDGCRVPIPWTREGAAYGFSPAGSSAAPWLPQPAVFGELAVDQQEGVAGSTLELYRALLALRRERGLGSGSLAFVELGADIVAFDVTGPAGTTRVVLNLGDGEWEVPGDLRILAASDPAIASSGRVPTDGAVWLAV